MAKKPPKKRYKKRKPLKTPANPPGRPSIYSIELAAEFCARMMDGPAGRSVAEVCKDDDMPTERTIYRWDDPDGPHPEFCQLLARASDRQFDKVASRLITIGGIMTSPVNEESKKLDPNRVRVGVDAYDKAARLRSEKKPRRIEMSGPGGGPLSFDHVDMSGWTPEMIRQYRDSLAATKSVLQIADQSGNRRD